MTAEETPTAVGVAIKRTEACSKGTDRGRDEDKHSEDP
jgi:hypothetical protein